jgi:hypothetical protein
MRNTHEKQNMDIPSFEEVRIQFIAAWESDERPTLSEFARKYPSYTAELVAFVLDFLALNNAAETTPESTAVPEKALQILDKMMAVAEAKPKDLSAARQLMDWTPSQLAQHLNLPNDLVLKVVRGYEEWPPRMIRKISQIFALPLSQAATLLANTRPAVATQFKAVGQPESTTNKGKSFQSDLEEFDRQGKLTPEQRREWIEEDS